MCFNYVKIMYYQKVYAWHWRLCLACCYSGHFVTSAVSEIYRRDLQIVFIACLRFARTCSKLYSLYYIRACEDVELAVCLISTVSWTPCSWFVSHVGQGTIEYTVLVVGVFSLLEYDDTSLCDWCNRAAVVFMDRIFNLWDVWQPQQRSHVPEERWLPLRNPSNSPVSD